jgi:hypothetical protein
VLSGASWCFPVVPQCFPVARQRRMFHPPANAPHAAVAYRTTALDARRHDRAGGGKLFLNFEFVDRQLIENNSSV